MIKKKFYEMAKGLEKVKEGGVRCFKCYELRLRETAEIAKEGGYDYFYDDTQHQSFEKCSQIE